MDTAPKNKSPNFQKLTSEFLAQIQSQFPADFMTREPSELENYGRDWTRIFPVHPQAVVFPRNTQEVAQFLRLCTQHRVPVVPSGGRTGLAGGAVASQGEVVLSLTRMNHIGPVDLLSSTVKVQAGVVTEALHQHCRPHHLIWPVDFASKGSSQIGGNISTNAGGVKVIHYGATRNWVLGLQVVTMAGEILEINGALEKNNTGLDLRHLFIGTEGTLGIITEAILKLTQSPKDLHVFFVALDGMPSVLKLFKEVRKAPFTLHAFETLTHNCLKQVTAVRGLKMPFDMEHQAYALFEVEKPESPDAQLQMDAWLEGLFTQGLVEDGTQAQSPREAKELWTLREGISESLGHLGLVYKNDIALPINELENFIAEMYLIFENRTPKLEVFLFGHIGDGNLHVNTLKPQSMDRDTFVEICKETDEQLFSLLHKHQGSISAEHGIGLLKKPFLHFSRSEAEIRFMKEIKQVFDPLNLLNPGKIF